MGTAERTRTEAPLRRKLKLLYVDTETVWRGGQEQIYTLITGMLQCGHRVWLAAPPDAPLAARAKRAGANLFSFQQRFELSPLAAWQLLSFMRESRFHIVHFNTQHPLLAGGLAASLSSPPPALVCSRRVNFPLRTSFSRLKFNLFMDRVITVSASIRDTLIHDGVRPSLVEVIYEGTDLQSIDAMPEPPSSIADDQPVIGIVAHLSKEKGHSILVKAVSLLLQSYPRLVLSVVGEGPLRTELERLAKTLGASRNVFFLGFREDADSVMKSFDIFCLPSLSEGLSSAILVAMSHRLPVVATAVGGIPELVIDRETGLLVSPRDPERLAGALQELLDSPDLRKRMGESGRRRVEAHFTLEKKIRNFERLYLELLGQLPIE